MRKQEQFEIARFFPMREQFWLNHLSEFREQDVVFICGDFHVDRFAKLLDQAAIPNEIVQRGIGVIEEDARRMAYLMDRRRLDLLAIAMTVARLGCHAVMSCRTSAPTLSTQNTRPSIEPLIRQCASSAIRDSGYVIHKFRQG
jgi:hypothetical protein